MTDKRKPGEDEELDLLPHDGEVDIEIDGERSPLAGDHEDTVVEVEEPAPEEDAYTALESQFKKLEAERNQVLAERDAVRQRAEQLERSQANAQINELQNHKVIIEHAIAAVNTEVEEAKRSYRGAREMGDIDAEIAATEVLSDAKDKLRQLTAGYHEISSRLERPQPVQQRQAAPAGDPIEQVIVENFPHPRDQAWLRAHRGDIFKSEERKEDVLAVERTARIKGIQPHTDEYYAYLDRELGYDEPVRQAPAARKPKPTPPQEQRRAPLPGAPVSRSGSGPSQGIERASPAIKALAADLGMSVSEYMQNERLIRDGKTHHRYSN